MGIDELAAIVRAGCDEDERVAMEVADGPNKPEVWTAVERHYSDIRRWHVDGQPSNVASGMFEPDARHAARHNPHRTMAEVASKRALLDEALSWEHGCSFSGEGCSIDPCLCGRDERVQAVLTHLAAPYQEA